MNIHICTQHIQTKSVYTDFKATSSRVFHLAIKTKKYIWQILCVVSPPHNSSGIFSNRLNVCTEKYTYISFGLGVFYFTSQIFEESYNWTRKAVLKSHTNNPIINWS